MDTIEILPLTQQAIARLLAHRETKPAPKGSNGRRAAPRWPFPGTVELWIPDENGVEYHLFATSINLSTGGVGVRCHDELDTDLELSIAIHEPEASFHGRAVVRHCTEVEGGYYIGLQFLFDKK